MKKKILVLVSLLFLLCGCSAEVNLEIKSDRVKETVVIHASPEGDYTASRLPDAFRKFVPAYAKDVLADAEPDVKKSGVSYYNRKQEQEGNGYKFTYDYNFKLNNYKEARTVQNGFKSSNVYVDKAKNSVLLSTDSSGLLYFDSYPYLTNVTINITSDYKVVESNADYVNGNVYSWELSRTNNNKNIYILLDKSAKFDEDYMIDIDDDYEEEPDGENGGGTGSNSGSTNKDEQDKEKEDKKDSSSKLEEDMNKNPFFYIVLGVICLVVFVFLFTKFAKITKVK